MMDAGAVKKLSTRINQMLPDDPREAVTVLALNLANVAVAAGLDDESAIEAVRRALSQMREGDWWKTH